MSLEIHFFGLVYYLPVVNRKAPDLSLEYKTSLENIAGGKRTSLFPTQRKEFYNFGTQGRTNQPRHRKGHPFPPFVPVQRQGPRGQGTDFEKTFFVT